MVKPDKLVIGAALVSGISEFASFMLLPEEMGLTRLVSSPHPLTFLCIFTLVAIPIAFAMPCLRASFMGQLWAVPSSTYLIPRWIVRSCIGCTLGQALVFFVLAIVQDHRYFWIAGWVSIVGAAFYVGAWQRLKKHPGNEFTMRYWPRM